MDKRLQRLAGLAIALGTVVSTAAAWAGPKAAKAPSQGAPSKVAPAPAAATASAAPTAPKPERPAADPRQYVESLYRRLNQLSKDAKDLTSLHRAIGDELRGVLRLDEMARQTLPTTWATLQPAQRDEFTLLLGKMVTNTYVKRFRPGSEVTIAYKQVRPAGDGRSEVQTTLTVQKTSADVHYALVGFDGRWWVYDIVVDEASQVQSYRQNFAKILNKEGWSGLIARMKKAADKKGG